VVNGKTFYRITEGNITFNQGFANCSFWNQTNLAEVRDARARPHDRHRAQLRGRPCACRS